MSSAKRLVRSTGRRSRYTISSPTLPTAVRRAARRAGGGTDLARSAGPGAECGRGRGRGVRCPFGLTLMVADASIVAATCVTSSTPAPSGRSR